GFPDRPPRRVPLDPEAAYVRSHQGSGVLGAPARNGQETLTDHGTLLEAEGVHGTQPVALRRGLVEAELSLNLVRHGFVLGRVPRLPKPRRDVLDRRFAVLRSR